MGARREAAIAQQQTSQSWTPEPAALELSNKTDRLNSNLGAREYEVGVAVPLWLPGERGRTQAIAQAESRAIESRSLAAQLRVAAAVREAWWNWQRASAEVDAARAQLDSASRIAADVGKRLKAGDLARADEHQAEGAVAAPESAVAQAQAALITTQQQLRAMTNQTEFGTEQPRAAPEPEPGASTAALDTHGELLALQDKAAVADGLAALASTQSRTNPERTLATTRERGISGEAYQQPSPWGFASLSAAAPATMRALPRHAPKPPNSRPIWPWSVRA